MSEQRDSTSSDGSGIAPVGAAPDGEVADERPPPSYPTVEVSEDEEAQRLELEEQKRDIEVANRRLEAELDAVRATKQMLGNEVETLKASSPAAMPDAASLPPSLARGLALPSDEASRDELVERLLAAKQQIDALLQECAQTRVKLRLLESQAKKA